MPHIIQREIIEVGLRSSASGMGIPAQLEDYFKGRMAKSIESVFDLMDYKGESIVIDKIEIDLGAFQIGSSVGFDITDLDTKLRKALETNLKNAIDSVKNPSTLSTDGRFELLTMYLAKGYLPWWGSEQKLSQVVQWASEEIEAFRQNFENFASKESMTRLYYLNDLLFENYWKKVSKDSPYQEVFDGLFKTLSIKEVVALKIYLVVALSKTDATKQSLHKMLSEAGISGHSIIHKKNLPPSFGLLLSERLKKYLGEKGLSSYFDSQDLPQNTLKQNVLNIIEECLAETLWLIDEEKPSRAKLHQMAKEWLEGKVQHLPSNSKSIIHKITDAILDKLPSYPAESQLEDNTSQANNDSANDQNKKEVSEELSNEGIIVDFAGIVLVAPYLPPFLSHMGLLEGGKFKDREKQDKAFALLWYLAKGNDKPEELKGFLLKFLLGIPASQAITPLELTTNDKADADVLLQNIISNWEKLGQTSIVAFRESFIDRSGKLMIDGGSPTLIVEHKGIDLLLNYLPWTISIILLPWLKKNLLVDWKSSL